MPQAGTPKPAIAIVDCETNGLDGHLRAPIEVSYVVSEDLSDLASSIGLVNDTETARKFPPSVTGCCTRYRAPNDFITPEAMAVHHIIPADLVEFPYFAAEVLPFEYAIGHNVDFDLDILDPNWTCKRICTLAISRRLWPDAPSHSLSALIYRLYASGEARHFASAAHGATADVLLCSMLLTKILICRTDIRSIDRLWQFSEDCRIPERMPFGKHKGERLADLPSAYVSWLLNSCDNLDPYLRKALEDL